MLELVDYHAIVSSCYNLLLLLLIRYRFFATHGIDAEHVAPLDTRVIDDALAFLAPKLKHGRGFMIEHLADEVNEDYLMGVKKATIEFGLGDQRGDEFKKVVHNASCSCPQVVYL